MRLDDALEKASWPIKIDIERFEKPAIEDLHTVLDQFRPVVVFEMTLTRKNSVGLESA